MKRVAALLLMAAAMSAGEAEPAVWFNHKQHAAFSLTCVSCHAGAGKSARAGMPSAARCLACHKGMPASNEILSQLLKMQPGARPFHAEYDTLQDFVIFSHARHARGKVACEACHGEVNEQERPEPAQALNMKACVDCHKARAARTNCNLCHKLASP